MVVIEKPAYGLIKLSVLLFYRRIFTTEAFRSRNNIVIILIALWALAFFLAEVFVCGSRPAILWRGKPSKGQCVNQAQLLLWFAITDIIGDIAVLTMPYGCIRRLQMDRRKKSGLIGIFMLGALSVQRWPRTSFSSDADLWQSIGCRHHSAGLHCQNLHRYFLDVDQILFILSNMDDQRKV